jgi:hypothetical protein
MAALPPIPPGTHAHAGNDAMCEPRERASAIIAIIFAFMLALCIFVAAFLAHRGGGGSGLGGSGGLASSGIGSGDGSGIGPGSGTGAADAGSGPGAGDAGSGRGDRGPDEPMPPAGSDADVVAQADAPPAAAPVPDIEPPEFGFTAPEPPKPAPQPVPTVVATGTPIGRPTSGAAGAGGGGGSEFMGIRSAGEHVVYVIDRSGSMSNDDRFIHACLELKRSIERLPASGSFSVIFFSAGPYALPPGALVKATKRSKEEAGKWIDSIIPMGNTDPTLALQQALAMKPQAIYLMTDGAFDVPPAVFGVIDQYNADRSVSINTVAFYDRSSEFVLQKIAKENNGDYRFVGPAGVSP